MATPLLVGMGVAQAASSLFSGISGYKGAKEAEKQAKQVSKAQQEEFIRQIVEEQKFRSEQRKSELTENRRRMSAAEGIYAKSGLLLTGSPAMALEEQQRIDEYNISQMDKQSQSRIEALRAEARIALLESKQTISAIETQGQTSLIGGLFGAAQGAFSIYSGLQTPQTPNPLQQPAKPAIVYGSNAVG